MHLGNIADLDGCWLLLSSAAWAHQPKTLTSLKTCIYSFWPSWPAKPVPLERAQLNAADRIQLCLPEWSQNSCCWKSSLFSDSLKLAYRQLLSLFTAFTLVQLRSLLRSKCWQAIFINHVRLNVFKCMYLRKNNHALVLFLFSSRPWFLAFCFPWLLSLVQRIQFHLQISVLN